jgi:RNA polymerase sigma-70 factor (ECF subfamily)
MTQADSAQAAGDVAARCAAGEVEAYAEVYREHGASLYATACRMLGDRAEAEDVVQEAFLSLLRHAAELQGGNLGAWLRRVVANACIDRIRARGRWRTEEVDDMHLTAIPEAPATLRVDLERAVAALPPGARTVFLLHDVEGFLHSEVAALLGIAEGASKSQLVRARALLRHRLGGSEEAQA